MAQAFLPVLFGVSVMLGCAETDPYKRLDPAPTPDITQEQAAEAFDTRWPLRFKTVQTVTIDFRVKTMTLVGYLIVQDSSFRLQGMTEQGLKLFDIAYSGGETKTVFAAEEFDASIIENISRDIRRVFLERVNAVTSGTRVSIGEAGLVFEESGLRMDGSGTRLTTSGENGEFDFKLIGDGTDVDWYEHNRDDRNLYRVDHYEWQELGGEFIPSTIVLRERGVVSAGPSYKLTIKITEFEKRESPWPEAVFDPPVEDE